MEGGFILIGLIILLIIGLIWANISEQKDFKDGNEKINSIRDEVKSIEDDINKYLIEIGRWVNRCRKCSGSVYFIKNYSERYVTIVCEGCNKVKTLNQFNDHKYEIACIPKLELLISKIYSILEPIKNRAMPYVEDKYFSNGKSLTGRPEYEFIHNLQNKYFIDHTTKKTYGLHWNPQLRVFADGDLIDQVNADLKSKKIEKKLGKRRKELSEEIIDEWNYLKIKSGKKNNLIKDWAINSKAKCPDGSKCGGVYFKDLQKSQIALGHFLPQDYAKEMPHFQKEIHHPDNLYLTCNSCNSALGGNPPDKELKKRIFNTGTVGDWIRDKLKNSTKV